MDIIKSFLETLPKIADSPLAIIAYIILIGG